MLLIRYISSWTQILKETVKYSGNTIVTLKVLYYRRNTLIFGKDIYAMKPINLFFAAIAIVLISQSACYNTERQVNQPNEFTGAEAKLDSYKALYIINSSDDKRVKGALRNIKNALEDPRLKGKLEIELIVFSDGVEIYKTGSPYEETLLMLKDKGIALAQCENTLKERKIYKSELYPFVSYVPTGNGEIILRHYEGWAIVHP